MPPGRGPPLLGGPAPQRDRSAAGDCPWDREIPAPRRSRAHARVGRPLGRREARLTWTTSTATSGTRSTPGSCPAPGRPGAHARRPAPRQARPVLGSFRLVLGLAAVLVVLLVAVVAVRWLAESPAGVFARAVAARASTAHLRRPRRRPPRARRSPPAPSAGRHPTPDAKPDDAGRHADPGRERRARPALIDARAWLGGRRSAPAGDRGWRRNLARRQPAGADGGRPGRRTCWRSSSSIVGRTAGWRSPSRSSWARIPASAGSTSGGRRTAARPGPSRAAPGQDQQRRRHDRAVQLRLPRRRPTASRSSPATTPTRSATATCTATADGGRTWSADRPTGTGGAGVEGSSLAFATAEDGVIVGSPEGSGSRSPTTPARPGRAPSWRPRRACRGDVRFFGRPVFFDAHDRPAWPSASRATRAA